MAKMGKYCKAYPLPRFRAYNGWAENSLNARKETLVIDGAETEAPRELTDNAHLYLQEDYTVTDGVFLEENVIYANGGDDWIEFCKTELKFEIPVYEPLKISQAAASGVEGR